MRQTALHLTDEDRKLVESYCSKGLHRVREVNRAHILSALDRKVPEAQIVAVLGVGRTAIWRTRSAYLELLEQTARAQEDMGPISRETIRRLLKKTASSRGAS